MTDDRDALESMIAADVRAMNAESDQIGRHFAGRHDVLKELDDLEPGEPGRGRGRPGVVVVHGTAGVGKTALLDYPEGAGILRVDRASPEADQYALLHPCRSQSLYEMHHINSLQCVTGFVCFDGSQSLYEMHHINSRVTGFDCFDGIDADQGGHLPNKTRAHHCALRRGWNCRRHHAACCG